MLVSWMNIYFSTELLKLLHNLKFDFLFEQIILLIQLKDENVYNHSSG
jgi:hypothetical protein